MAFFLLAFNKETVYQLANEPSTIMAEQRTIEVIIDKTTTDAELAELKSDMKSKDVDFSYTVVRNNEGEIINISFDIKGKSKDGSPFSGSYNPSS
ncbi:MAG: M56 family peptidase, partial [Promethearchaeota archaeon]